MTETDPRFEPDTFLRLSKDSRDLYEVVEVDGDQVRLKNSKTLHDLYLPCTEVARALIVYPEPVTVPAEWMA